MKKAAPLDWNILKADAHPLKETVLTLPNVISCIRILLTPVFVWAMIAGRQDKALIVFAAACVTDALDGLTARVFNVRSSLGLILDPMGDKLLLTAGFVMLTIPALSKPYCLPLWLTVVCIGRDILIVIAAVAISIVRGATIFRPSFIGKTATVIQVTTLFTVLAANSLGRHFGILPALFHAAGAVTIISGVSYLIREFGHIKAWRASRRAAG